MCPAGSGALTAGGFHRVDTSMPIKLRLDKSYTCVERMNAHEWGPMADPDPNCTLGAGVTQEVVPIFTHVLCATCAANADCVRAQSG